MMPHEQLLVTRFRDKPFAVLGINLDADKALPQELVDRKEVSFRNWWDRDHVITSLWHVKVLPTLYVVDQNGIIRFYHLGLVDPETLESTIGQLLNSASRS